MARRGNVRLGAIVVAVILAVVATVALVSYIRGVESRTQEQLAPVQAFVAADLVPAGTSAEAAVAGGLIEQRDIPSAAVPPGAITSLAQIEGTVAASDIQPGEVILEARFGEVTQTARGLRPIPEGQQAISVEVSVPPGVAGFISPGDFVSLLAQFDVPVEGDDEEAGETTQAQLAFLVQSVEVLAVGRRVVQAEGQDQVQPTEQVLVTLAVDAEQAEQVAFAALNGSMWFTLLPEELEAPVDTPGRTLDNIFE